MGATCSTCSNPDASSHKERPTRNTDTTKINRTRSSSNHNTSEDYISSDDNGMITDEDPQLNSNTNSAQSQSPSGSSPETERVNNKAEIEKEIITEFQQYVKEGNISMVMLLNDENPSMNLMNTKYTNGDNCLLTSVKNDRYNITEYLLRSGISVKYSTN